MSAVRHSRLCVACKGGSKREVPRLLVGVVDVDPARPCGPPGASLVGRALVGLLGPLWGGPLWVPLGPCVPGPCGPALGLHGLGPCGLPWALVGWALVRPLGRLLAGP